MKTETKAKRAKAPASKTAACSKAAKPRSAQSACDAYGVDALCDAIRNGETLTGISRALGVARSSLLVWISADPDRSARVREARQDAASFYEERALEELAQSETPFELARAKEIAHHLRWRASKVNSKEYGDKVQADINGSVNLTLFDGEQARRMAEQLTRDSSRA